MEHVCVCMSLCVHIYFLHNEEQNKFYTRNLRTFGLLLATSKGRCRSFKGLGENQFEG